MEVWKLCGCFLSFCCLLLCTTASSDIFDGVLGNTASCHNTCQMTYSLHTYPREEELYACQRGCRLFSICQFVSDGEDLNQTKSECDSACREAYSQSDEQYACSLGCQSQLPFAEQRQEQLMAMVPRIHLLYPLALVRGFWNEMMSSAHNFISSTWTFYLQADNGKVVIFQSEPQIQFIPEFEPQNDDLREPTLAKSSCDLDADFLADGQDIGSSERFQIGCTDDKIVVEKAFVWRYRSLDRPVFLDSNKGYAPERESDMYLDKNDVVEDYSLFSCLSRNPWLPGWILTTTLVLSVLVLIWICCATVATAVDQYVPAEKLSIYGDMDYINDQKLTPYSPSSLVILSSKAEEEAGPLPSKVNLNHSSV